MSLRPATRQRIEDAHRFSAFYRGYLANHLPMALVALDGLGADDAAIARFDAGYAPKLEPLESHAEFARVARDFGQRIAREGRDAVLGAEIDRLAAAPASGAFHGAIRAAYALEADLDRELAHALAYWTLEFAPLPEPGPFTGTRSPHEVLACIGRDRRFSKRRFPGRNIVERTRNAAADPGFAALVASVDPAQLSLQALAGALIRAYAASGDFTLLHGVTGTHAMRLLAPHARDPRRALAHLWQALVAAYLGAGSPAVEGWGVEGSDALSWDSICARAVHCDDEHDVKLAYSCLREGAHYRDDQYRRVASSRVCHALRESMAC